MIALLLVPGFILCVLGGFFLVRGVQEAEPALFALAALLVVAGATCNGLAMGGFW